MTPLMKKPASESAKTTPNYPPLDVASSVLATEQAKGFQLIGQFITEFSQLEFTIRFVLFGQLKIQQEYFDIVTAPYDFAILCTVTQAVLCKQLPDKKPSIERLFKDCKKLNDERVRVAHGLWTLGHEGPVARHVSRGSLKPKIHFEQPDSLSMLAVEAQRLMQQVLTIGN